MKFALHFLSHISFCAYATSLFMILKDDFIAARGTGEQVSIRASEIIYWMWCISRIVGELCELPDLSIRAMIGQLQDPFNRIDYIIIALNILSTSIRVCAYATTTDDPAPPHGAAPYVDPMVQQLPMDLYALVLVFSYYRFLQYLRIYRSIGVLSIVIDSLAMDVARFTVIMIIFILAFSFSFAIIFPNPSEYKGWEFLGGHPLYLTFWGVVGGIDTIEVLTILKEQRDQPTVTLACILLWIFQFMTGVVLVNLLIAMMSDTYAGTTSEGERRWLYNRSILIREYLEKPPMPSPLNILWYLFYQVPHWFTKRLGKRSKHEIDLTGYKLVPPLRYVQRYENIEREARKTALAESEALRQQSQMAKLEKLEAKMEQMDVDQRTYFENISGQFDAINSRLRSLTFALEQVAGVHMGRGTSAEMLPPGSSFKIQDGSRRQNALPSVATRSRVDPN